MDQFGLNIFKLPAIQNFYYIYIYLEFGIHTFIYCWKSFHQQLLLLLFHQKCVLGGQINTEQRTSKNVGYWKMAVFSVNQMLFNLW